MLPKLILTLVFVLVVWYGYKYVSRLQRLAAEARRTATVDETKKPQVPDIEETVRCPACGTYVPARRARHCGRADCPYPR